MCERNLSLVEGVGGLHLRGGGYSAAHVVPAWGSVVLALEGRGEGSLDSDGESVPESLALPAGPAVACFYPFNAMAASWFSSQYKNGSWPHAGNPLGRSGSALPPPTL